MLRRSAATVVVAVTLTLTLTSQPSADTPDPSGARVSTYPGRDVLLDYTFSSARRIRGQTVCPCFSPHTAEGKS